MFASMPALAPRARERCLSRPQSLTKQPTNGISKLCYAGTSDRAVQRASLLLICSTNGTRHLQRSTMASCLGGRLQLQRASAVAPARSRRSLTVQAYQFDVSVRPYTLRKGDKLGSIASKRGFTLQQVLSMNPDVDPDKLKEGQTILLPAGKLSSRDKEILEGIGHVYRVYPVRKGESLKDVITKRAISRQEMLNLNPGVNLDRLKEGQLLKLPSNKFTVREREMLIGSGILPPEFFQATRNPFVVGVGALLLVCGFVMAWQQFYDEDKAEDEEEALA